MSKHAGTVRIGSREVIVESDIASGYYRAVAFLDGREHPFEGETRGAGVSEIARTIAQAVVRQNPCRKANSGRCPVGTRVQTILLPKSKFSPLEAARWLDKHGKAGALDEGGPRAEFLRARQAEPSSFRPGTLRTIRFGDSGIKAVVGCPKSAARARGRAAANPKSTCLKCHAPMRGAGYWCRRCEQDFKRNVPTSGQLAQIKRGAKKPSASTRRNCFDLVPVVAGAALGMSIGNTVAGARRGNPSRSIEAIEMSLSTGHPTGHTMIFFAPSEKQAAKDLHYTLSLKSSGWKIGRTGLTVSKGDTSWVVPVKHTRGSNPRRSNHWALPLAVGVPLGAAAGWVGRGVAQRRGLARVNPSKSPMDSKLGSRFSEDDPLVGRRVLLGDRHGGFTLLVPQKGGYSFDTLWRPGSKSGTVRGVDRGRFYQTQENVAWLLVQLDKTHGRYSWAQAYYDERTGKLLHGDRWEGSGTPSLERRAWSGGTPPASLRGISTAEKQLVGELYREQLKEFVDYWGKAPDKETKATLLNRARHDAHATFRGERGNPSVPVELWHGSGPPVFVKHARVGRANPGPKTTAGYQWFRKHGLPARSALSLSKGEVAARQRGWKVTWEFDEYPDLSWASPKQKAAIKEVLVAILRDGRGNVLASLGGIVDPSREYAREIEAELAAEALGRRGNPAPRALPGDPGFRVSKRKHLGALREAREGRYLGPPRLLCTKCEGRGCRACSPHLLNPADPDPRSGAHRAGKATAKAARATGRAAASAGRAVASGARSAWAGAKDFWGGLRAENPVSRDKWLALVDAARGIGMVVETYSPGDGVTRYRFFRQPVAQGQSYFGPADGAYTALGWKDAYDYATGMGKYRSKNPKGHGFQDDPAFDRFPTWQAVLDYVRTHKVIWYWAPMSYRPASVAVKLTKGGRAVRVLPAPSEADPFTADAGHLDRFRKRAGQANPVASAGDRFVSGKTVLLEPRHPELMLQVTEVERQNPRKLPGFSSVRKVRLSGDYDSQGRYWGSGPPPLFVGETTEGDELFTRASSRDHALERLAAREGQARGGSRPRQYAAGLPPPWMENPYVVSSKYGIDEFTNKREALRVARSSAKGNGNVTVQWENADYPEERWVEAKFQGGTGKRLANPAKTMLSHGTFVQQDERSKGCRRCKGAKQVKLGKNVVSCPTCCRKNPLTKSEVASEIRQVRKAVRHGQADERSGIPGGAYFEQGYAHGVAGVIFRKGPKGYATSKRAQHGVMLALEDKPSFFGPRQKRGVALHAPKGKASLLGPRKRNPLDSHKPGCQCMFHSGRMFKKGAR